LERKKIRKRTKKARDEINDNERKREREKLIGENE
jgi:hypothetical protein